MYLWRSIIGTDPDAVITLGTDCLIPYHIFPRKGQCTGRTLADANAAAVAQPLCLRVVAVSTGDITALDKYCGPAAWPVYYA